ncbi:MULTISPECIES: T9SS type A sorting domain-containing protein [unclassified Lentimicrobium]|uniref:T9SS type A sorting domain-containing protein n=1 Tax=unclassified Lentimicrobium TaxID=2677434 RepID=UPI001557805E|nr:MULTISPECIES: T9SS type A sorting domain-containing protein [unclassified Lentimicrobium]NPD45673.1 T9SS type A sorting domain-containing protein [Lentimicrobium sp. S6]NPD85552.1 T9SS type A sorting domain-containing protein [Lentimicrobium sp. L6]
MKKNYFLALLLQAFVILGIGQSVNQIVVGNGGIYNNDADHVMVTGINPETYTSTLIGEVVKESMQDLIVVGDYAYVAAEDSLAKFNLITNTKEIAIYHGYLSRLYYANDMIYVSLRSDATGVPADGKYLKAFDMNLNLVYEAEGISTDAAGMLMYEDSLYVAVSGDWAATEGKLAVTNSDLSFVREINLGTDAVGIIDLFEGENVIYSVNKSPYGATTGSISTYNIATTTWNTQSLNHVVGKGVRKVGDLLYLGLDYGIGSYDLSTSTVVNNQIIADPGSASYINIAAAVFDEINERFYVTITDYFSLGEGRVYDIDGTVLGNFEASVSAEAMAIHYANNTGLSTLKNNSLNIYPNPCQNFIHIGAYQQLNWIEIYNQTGQLIKRIHNPQSSFIEVNELKAGIYFIKTQSQSGIHAARFLKK